MEKRHLKPSIEKMAFFSSMLEKGYHVRLRVTGNSMSPFLETGNYVVLSRIPLAELKIGDIIFCSCDDGSYKLHRLIAIKSELLITKGDALGLPDEPFQISNYQGKVIRIEQHRSQSIIIRNMELRSVQTANYLIAVFHRLKLHLICKYFGIILKPT